MNLHHCKKIAILFTVCCVLTCMATVRPVQADRTRVLTVALLTAGVGLKFGSVFVEKLAQDAYDQYLRTAIQTDIVKFRDDYSSKHNQSVIMSRTGMGLVGLAMFISLFDNLDLISKSAGLSLSKSAGLSLSKPSLPQPHALRLTPHYNPRTHELAFLLQRHF